MVAGEMLIRPLAGGKGRPRAVARRPEMAKSWKYIVIVGGGKD